MNALPRKPRSPVIPCRGWIAGLIITGFALFLIAGVNQQVPSYQGKSLLQWMEELRSVRSNFDSSPERAARQEAAEAAIRAISTNALVFAWADVSAEPAPQEPPQRQPSINAPSRNTTPLKVEDRWMRGAVTLEVLGPLAKPLLPNLITLASNRMGYAATGYAERALLAVGPDALPALTNLLATSTYPKTGNLIAALANVVSSNRITPEQADMALPSLVNVWHSTDNHARSYVADAFGAIHQNAGLCVPLLVEGISDPEQNIRMSSIRSLGAFGDAASVHAGKVTEAFDRADSVTRASICNALAGFKSAQEITIPVLIRGLQDTNETVAVLAAQALAHTRHWPDLTLPALSKASRDPRPIVRMISVQSIGFYRGAAGDEIQTLEQAATDPDASVRNAATNALNWILQPF